MRIEDRGVARREIAALVRQEAERLSGSTGDNAAPAVELAPPDDTPWASLKRELPLIDLVIVAPSLAAGLGVLAGPLGEVMMDARTPVLVARAETLAPGRPAAVAWDGSLEAGRAVRAAMPLLKEASRVAIVQQIEEIDASAGARSRSRAAETLSRWPRHNGGNHDRDPRAERRFGPAPGRRALWQPSCLWPAHMATAELARRWSVGRRARSSRPGAARMCCSHTELPVGNSAAALWWGGFNRAAQRACPAEVVSRTFLQSPWRSSGRCSEV